MRRDRPRALRLPARAPPYQQSKQVLARRGTAAATLSEPAIDRGSADQRGGFVVHEHVYNSDGERTHKWRNSLATMHVNAFAEVAGLARSARRVNWRPERLRKAPLTPGTPWSRAWAKLPENGPPPAHGQLAISDRQQYMLRVPDGGSEGMARWNRIS